MNNKFLLILNFDVFSVRELDRIVDAKNMCDILDVAIIDDENSIIPSNEKVEIVSALKYVDACFLISADESKHSSFSEYNLVLK